MEDKILMNTILTLTKNMIDTLMHGAIESSTPKIKETFMKNLNEYLTLQGSIYKEMENAGLYKMEQVPETKITDSLSKFECELN